MKLVLNKFTITALY